MGIKWCCPKELNLRLSSRWNALPTELETTQNLEGNVGFEPTEPFSPAVFKTAALDHYANSPCVEEGTGIEPETFQPEMFSKHSPKPFSITFLKIVVAPHRIELCPKRFQRFVHTSYT